MLEERARIRKLQSTRFDIQATLETSEVSDADKRKAMEASRRAAQLQQDAASSAKREADLEKLVEKLNATSLREEKLRKEELALKKEVATKLKQLEDYKRKKQGKDLRAARLAFFDRHAKPT